MLVVRVICGVLAVSFFLGGVDRDNGNERAPRGPYYTIAAVLAAVAAFI